MRTHSPYPIVTKALTGIQGFDEIVDRLDHPQRARADRIIVTSRLLMLAPLPQKRLVGSLSDTQQLLLALTSP